MIGKTNASLGGGGGEVFALIQQPYPAGSTCTCSKGDIVLTAKDTSGLAIFAVTEAGTWTITTTNGTQTKTTTVEITTKGETVTSAELVYESYLYDAGEEYTALTGGWASTQSGVASVEKFEEYISLNNEDSWDCYIYTGKAINMANYSVLNVRVSDAWATNGNGYMYIDVGDGTARMESASTGSRTYTLDVSAVTSGVVKVGAQGYWSDDMNTKSSFGMEVIRIWLS